MSPTLASTMRAHWRAVRDQAIAALDALDRLPPPDDAAAPRDEPRMMKIITYGQARDIPESTLRGYLAEGLPSRGAGRSRRILVAEADAWLERRRGGRDG